MSESAIGFGIIGGGLMGREFASAAARWIHLAPVGARPEIVCVADLAPEVLSWYKRMSPAPRLVSSYEDLLADPRVDAVYCAVPHHLHEQIYRAAVRAGKHIMGEKPFGVDRLANASILAELARHPEVVACCSSEMPFYPGGQDVFRFLQQRRYGRLLEARVAFLHSSDLDPGKPINWKRQARLNGDYGCMGDLGMHAMHLPLRSGWAIKDVRALLSDIVTERPDGRGGTAACDTWDNATLMLRAEDAGEEFPLRVDLKRIAPGHTNTWSIEIDGTEASIAYSTKQPKTLHVLEYQRGRPQVWQVEDLGSSSAYPHVTGGIFEFGFSDAILQMWAAFIDEVVHGPDGMRQPFRCATPQETSLTHAVFTAALASHATNCVVEVDTAGVRDLALNSHSED